MTETRPTVLILFHYFGTEAGATGPAQSILNMIRVMSDRFRFRVIAEALEGEEPGRWGEFEGVERLPLKTFKFGIWGLRKSINETPHDLLLASSFFDPRFTILPLGLRKIGLLPRSPVLVAPRGEFAPAALAFSSIRKKLYIAVAQTLGLLRGVALQATSYAEAETIGARLPFFKGDVLLVPNLRMLPPTPPHKPRGPGEPLRVAFLSRIDRMKNLHFALDVLGAAGVPVIFNIFGPIFAGSADYWQLCERRAARMPAHVKVVRHGRVLPADVPTTLASQDLFFLPTLGENFGHAIVDALIAGTPVLLSDRTPWRGLEARGAGWDLPLSNKGAFASAIRKFAALEKSAEAAMRKSARRYIEEELDPIGREQEAAAAFYRLVDTDNSTRRD